MNKRILESFMKLNGDNGATLAKFLGISRGTFSAKLNETNGSEFTQGEIAKIKSRYSLTPKDIDMIFFDTSVSKKDTSIRGERYTYEK